jgi:hypothetical protein
MDESIERARRVKQTHESRWLALRGVVAVGIAQRADGTPTIIVSVETDSDPIHRQIPERVDDVPVEIRVAGPIQAQERQRAGD